MITRMPSSVDTSTHCTFHILPIANNYYYNQPASPHFLCRLCTLLPLNIPACSFFLYIIVKAILPLRLLISYVIPSYVLVAMLVSCVGSKICLYCGPNSVTNLPLPCDKFLLPMVVVLAATPQGQRKFW